MRKFLAIAGFVLVNLSILLVSFMFLSTYTSQKSSAQEVSRAETQDVSISSPIQIASITVRDTRIDKVETFFSKYGPKMVGLGKHIVNFADQYQIPIGILPSIGACEGGLGNAIPENSFNTWGWGIYGGKIKKYPNWETAIEDVSRGIYKEYYAKGLDTPEKMMSKYAPVSTGTWAVCVNKYFADFL